MYRKALLVLASVLTMLTVMAGPALASHVYVSVSCSTSAVKVLYNDGTQGWVNPCYSSSTAKNVNYWWVESGRQHYVEDVVTRVRYWTTCSPNGAWKPTNDHARYIYQKRVAC